MAKTIKINENFSLNYSSREADSSDTVMDCNINFDNPKDDCIIIYRLNTWLKAIGRIDIEVVSKENIKGLK
jgi:hypothetical protein